LQNTDILPTIIARDRLFEYDLLPELGAAQFPVLILHGEKNRVVPLQLLQALQKRLGGEIIQIPSAGYYTYLDNPEEVTKAILGFLGQN
ncbi:MAG: alpha/beta hydrolase, partial [Anaerolineae bacterium]|nr:alpha/beta hydrolase [Anaerolineae bacterium]